jgi:hypothetical protein
MNVALGGVASCGPPRSKSRISAGRIGAMFSESFKTFSHVFGDGVVLPSNRIPGVYDTFFRPSLMSALNRYNVEVPYVSVAGRRMRLELGFIINDRVRNAVCRREGEVMCCGLYSCLPFHFFEIAACCMSHSDFLPFLGPSYPVRKVRELLPDTVIFGFAPEHFQDRGRYEQFIASLQNQNPLRASVTYWLMHLMLELYWYHEVGHALSGHPDYLNEKRGLRAVSEDESGDGTWAVQRERILLEKQADAFASVEFFALDSIEGSMRAGTAFGLSRYQVCAIRMICVVLVCYSWIWTEFRGTTIERFSRVSPGLHPPAVVRYELWLRSMCQRTKKSEPVDKVLRNLGMPRKLLGERKAQEPRDTFVKAFEILEQNLDALVHLDASFEGIEYFRNSLQKQIASHQKEVGHDKLLKTIFEKYLYRQVEV